MRVQRDGYAVEIEPEGDHFHLKAIHVNDPTEILFETDCETKRLADIKARRTLNRLCSGFHIKCGPIKRTPAA